MSTIQRLLLGEPQYAFVICLYMSCKLLDLTYPHLRGFLKVCQQTPFTGKRDDGEPFFQRGLLDNFSNYEKSVFEDLEFNLSKQEEMLGYQSEVCQMTSF